MIGWLAGRDVPWPKAGSKINTIWRLNGLTGSRISKIAWHSLDARSKIQRVPKQNYLRDPGFVGSHYKVSGQDPGSTGSLKKMSFQYATSINFWIPDHVCPLYPPMLQKKRYRKLQSSTVTPSIKNVSLMVEDPPELMNFLRGRSSIQQQFFPTRS